MKAITWHRKCNMHCQTVPAPAIEDARDCIIKITACAICGSDLHVFNGVMPGIEPGDIMGLKTMGEVIEVGSGVSRLKKGGRVVVPFTIACGEGVFCTRRFFSGCEGFNPNKAVAEKTPVQRYLPCGWTASCRARSTPAW